MKTVTINGYTVEYSKLNDKQCKAKVFDFGIPIDERVVNIRYEDIDKDSSGKLVNKSLKEGR